MRGAGREADRDDRYADDVGDEGDVSEDEYEIATDSEDEVEEVRSQVKKGEGKSSTSGEQEEEERRRRTRERDERERRVLSQSEGRKMQGVVEDPPLPLRGGDEAASTNESKSGESKEAQDLTSNKEELTNSIPGGQIEVYDATMIPFERDSLRDWLVNPPLGGEEQMVRCFIERDKKGFNRFHPLFRFYIEVKGGPPRLLMYGKKLKGKMSGNYIISLDEKDMGKARHKRGDGYIGKLQTSGSSEFTVFDDGVNPNLDGMGAPVNTRREMCVVAYASKSKNRPTQDRRMEVAIPAIIARPDGQEHSVTWRPRTKEDGMRTWFRRIRLKGSQNVISRERMLCLHNRMWSHGRTCQLEEFMQRAQETSSKNFQLVVSPPEDPFLRNKYDASPLGTIDTDDVANVLVQMGRCSDRFNVDFQYPVSAFVAFGICLTRFCSSSGVKA